MIINTGQRTDIPAFFSKWFYNRIKAGFVLSRNPYYPEQVTRYRLTPDVVDLLCFCTKNPAPMLERLSEISQFRRFWFVTVNPYGKEIEPYVPDKANVIDAFTRLSAVEGRSCVGWRYDPIFITEKYSVEFHIEKFAEMAEKMRKATDQVVVSFIDLYKDYAEFSRSKRADERRAGQAGCCICRNST